MWAVWGNATAFLITISATIIPVSACSWTRLSLPQVGGFISQSSFPRIVTFPFIHCVPCQPSKVLVAPRLLFSGTLEGARLVLGQRGPPGTLFRERPCLHFHQRLLLARIQEGLRNGMLVALCPGEGLPRDQRTTTGWANHVLYHCALESPLDGPLWGRGESRPQACPRFRGLGSQSGPLIRTLVSILIFLVHRHFPRALCAVTLVLRNPS